MSQVFGGSWGIRGVVGPLLLCAFGTSGPRLSTLPCASLGMVARGGNGFRDVFGKSRCCGLAGRGAPAARHGSGRRPRQGSGRGPRQGMGLVFFGELKQAAPCSVSLSGFAADPCRAFQRFPAVFHGKSGPRLSALPCAAARGDGAGRWGFGVSLGIRGVAGSRAWRRLWRGRGMGGARGRGAVYEPRQGMGSRFFGELNYGSPCGVSLPGLLAHPCRAFGASLRCVSG